VLGEDDAGGDESHPYAGEDMTKKSETSGKNLDNAGMDAVQYPTIARKANACEMPEPERTVTMCSGGVYPALS